MKQRRRPRGKPSEIAKKRILEVAVDGLPSLSLKGLSIKKLPDLSDLNLQYLDLSDTNIKDISSLSVLPGLTELKLSRTRVDDISALAHLENITSLELSDTGVKDLSPLAGLVGLRNLVLSRTLIEDISQLRFINLQSLDITHCAITELSSLASHTNLVELFAGGTRVRDLAPLADLPLLRTLSVWETKIVDLSPLSGVDSLRELYAGGTKITDLSPIERLSLRCLSIYDTKISDLTPLRAMTSLIYGAKFSDSHGGLDARRCNVEPDLQRLAELDPVDATLGIINYLRDKDGLPLLDVDEIQHAEVLEEIASALRQNTSGAKFEPSDDYLVIAPSGDQSDLSVASEVATVRLHEVVRRRAQELSSRALRVSNLPGWQNLSVAADAFRELVGHDTGAVAENIAVVWSELVSLGSFIDQDDEVQKSTNALFEPLVLDVRRALIDLLQSAGPWVRKFPTARRLDDEHSAFVVPRLSIQPAQNIVAFAEQKGVIHREHATILHTALSAGGHSGHQSNKAGNFGIFSVRNLVVGAAAIAATGFLGGVAKYVGEEFAKQSILAEKTLSLIVSSEKSLLEFLKNVPPDVRAVLRSIVDQLRQDQPGGVPLPTAPQPNLAGPERRRRKHP